MRNILITLLLGCAVASAAHAATPISAAEASAAMALAKESGCLSCHATSEKIVGPAYAKVAEKYRDDKDAVATLTQSIQYGAKGKWGRIAMPPHASMSADDIKTLARWVLSIEK
jgi:cytochrome c